jgi:hypothetical protein
MADTFERATKNKDTSEMVRNFSDKLERCKLI